MDAFKVKQEQWLMIQSILENSFKVSGIGLPLHLIASQLLHIKYWTTVLGEGIVHGLYFVNENKISGHFF